MRAGVKAAILGSVNGRQRTALVVGLGALCIVGAAAASRLLASSGPDWFAYAPNTSVMYETSDSAVWRDVSIWAVAIAIWTAASYLILRGPSDDE